MDNKTYNREYYALNRKRILEQKRQYQKNNTEKLNKRNRKYYHTNDSYRKARQERMKKYKREWRLKNDYDLTQEQYELLLKLQGNRCAICKSKDWGKKGTPHIDHDHKTNKVRGILCQKCNQALGMMDDSPEKLVNASNYLLDNLVKNI